MKSLWSNIIAVNIDHVNPGLQLAIQFTEFTKTINILITMILYKCTDYCPKVVTFLLFVHVSM